jgi:hypothetical protein
VLAAGAGAAVDRLRMKRALEQENQPIVAGLDEGILSLAIPDSGVSVESLWVQYISVTNDRAPSCVHAGPWPLNETTPITVRIGLLAGAGRGSGW